MKKFPSSSTQSLKVSYQGSLHKEVHYFLPLAKNVLNKVHVWKDYPPNLVNLNLLQSSSLDSICRYAYSKWKHLSKRVSGIFVLVPLSNLTVEYYLCKKHRIRKGKKLCIFRKQGLRKEFWLWPLFNKL